eukprot:Clim_evm4s215 gene=Clim_evmTU4s215
MSSVEEVPWDDSPIIALVSSFLKLDYETKYFMFTYIPFGTAITLGYTISMLVVHNFLHDKAHNVGIVFYLAMPMTAIITFPAFVVSTAGSSVDSMKNENGLWHYWISSHAGMEELLLNVEGVVFLCVSALFLMWALIFLPWEATQRKSLLVMVEGLATWVGLVVLSVGISIVSGHAFEENNWGDADDAGSIGNAEASKPPPGFGALPPPEHSASAHAATSPWVHFGNHVVFVPLVVMAMGGIVPFLMLVIPGFPRLLFTTIGGRIRDGICGSNNSDEEVIDALLNDQNSRDQNSPLLPAESYESVVGETSPGPSFRSPIEDANAPATERTPLLTGTSMTTEGYPEDRRANHHRDDYDQVLSAGAPSSRIRSRQPLSICSSVSCSSIMCFVWEGCVTLVLLCIWPIILLMGLGLWASLTCGGIESVIVLLARSGLVNVTTEAVWFCREHIDTGEDILRHLAGENYPFDLILVTLYVLVMLGCVVASLRVTSRELDRMRVPEILEGVGARVSIFSSATRETSNYDATLVSADPERDQHHRDIIAQAEEDYQRRLLGEQELNPSSVFRFRLQTGRSRRHSIAALLLYLTGSVLFFIALIAVLYPNYAAYGAQTFPDMGTDPSWCTLGRNPRGACIATPQVGRVLEAMTHTGGGVRAGQPPSPATDPTSVVNSRLWLLPIIRALLLLTVNTAILLHLCGGLFTLLYNCFCHKVSIIEEEDMVHFAQHHTAQGTYRIGDEHA